MPRIVRQATRSKYLCRSSFPFASSPAPRPPMHLLTPRLGPLLVFLTLLFESFSLSLFLPYIPLSPRDPVPRKLFGLSVVFRARSRVCTRAIPTENLSNGTFTGTRVPGQERLPSPPCRGCFFIRGMKRPIQAAFSRICLPVPLALLLKRKGVAEEEGRGGRYYGIARLNCIIVSVCRSTGESNYGAFTGMASISRLKESYD